MNNKSPKNSSSALDRVDEIIDTSLTEFTKLKLILRTVREALGADRCWLLYPSEPNADKHLVAIEDTSDDYPGGHRLKNYSSANPVFIHIINHALTSKNTVSYDLSSLSTDLNLLYKQFKVKSQMACQVPIDNKEGWVIGVHHCKKAHHYSSEDKNFLTSISKIISPSLEKLLDIPNLLNAAELSSEVLENSQLAQSVYNIDRRIVYANKTYCELNQRQLKDIVRVHGKQFISDPYKTDFDLFFDEIEAKGHASSKSKKVTGSGNTIYTENSGATLLYNGQPHYLITSIDVTKETEALHALENSLDIQRAILEATDDGVLVEDLDRTVIAINQKFYDYFDIEPGRTDIIKTIGLLEAGLPSVLNQEEVAPKVLNASPSAAENTLITILLKNGTILELDAFPLIHNNGIKGRVWYFKNVTEQTLSTRALEDALDIQRAITEASDDGLLVEDINRRIIRINQSFMETFNIPEHEMEHKGESALKLFETGIELITNAHEIGDMIQQILPSSNKKMNFLMHLNDERVLDTTSFPLIREGLIHGRVWYFQDITEKHRLTDKLSFEATHDPLTKLVNRRGFDEILRNAIADIPSNTSVHALLYLDLDQFKIINDSSGHSAGDLALIEISKILTSILRKADALARVGGDEFCILLRDCSPEVAKKIAEKIRQAIDKFIFIWDEKEYNLGVSIGVVSLDETVKSYESALNLADTSCYLAK
ncbi:MAG TPA: hypothetical protein DCL50_01635 [Methylococcaceae bacterium]|nr:hypothetical protein [Methylococcaceae bacterium]